MRTVIYARYSAGPKQTDQSIDGQIRVCTTFCEAKGLEIVDEYCDKHISGRTAERPQFQKMLADAKLGKFDAVVVYKTDRFARDKYDSAIYKRELKQCGVQIYYAAEAIPDGPEGIILESLMEGLAEYYSAELAQKIKRGMHESALNCKSTGAGRPLGYLVDENKHFQIDPDAAPSVRTIFEMFIKGETPAAICEYLNDRGWRTVQGNPFNKNSINRIIKNRKYLGEYSYQGVVVPGGMPAIIDEDTFNLAQAELERRRTRRRVTAPKANYLLSGRLFCGHCRTPMQGVSGTGKSGNRWYYYYCGHARAKKGCIKKQVSRDKLEAHVVELVLKHVFQKGMLESIASRISEVIAKSDDRKEKLAIFEKKLAENKKGISNILGAIESGVSSPSLLTRLSELESTQTILAGEIAYLKNAGPVLSEDQILFALTQHMTHREGESLEDYHKRISTSFVSAVYLYDDKTVIFFNISGPDGRVEGSDLDLVESGEFAESLNGSTNLNIGRTPAVSFVFLPAGFFLVSINESEP